MRLNSFTVEGYKNLTVPVTFGPLGDLNAVHGPNNIGKTNLIRAIDLFFGLLAVGNQVSKYQFVTMDAGEHIPDKAFMPGNIDECEECSEPIGFKRLMARPVTTLCFECESAREQVEAEASATE